LPRHRPTTLTAPPNKSQRKFLLSVGYRTDNPRPQI
jgi:hypothetical protein